MNTQDNLQQQTLEEPELEVFQEPKRTKTYEETAVFLVDVLYKYFEDQREFGKRSLTVLEQGFIDAVDLARKDHEELHEQSAQRLLDDAYKILEDKNEWNQEEHELYGMLEKIILLGSKEGSLEKFFNDVGEVTASMMELDFTKRLEAPEGLRNEKNLLSYIALCLNMVNEELEAKVMPKVVADDMLTMMGEAAVIFVADQEGKVNYISKFAQNLFGLENDQLNGIAIEEVFEDFAAIKAMVIQDMQIVHHPVKLNPLGAKKSVTDGLLSSKKSFNEAGELQGVIYMLQASVPALA